MGGGCEGPNVCDDTVGIPCLSRVNRTILPHYSHGPVIDRSRPNSNPKEFRARKQTLVMSASLIGRLGSSAFRLSTTAVLM